MEILANVDEWVPTDEMALAQFLSSPTGLRFIPALLKNAPALLSKGDVNEILIRSGEVRAFQTMIETIMTLAHPVKLSGDQVATVSYPSPEKDTVWDDGHKLDSKTFNPGEVDPFKELPPTPTPTT